MIQAFQIAPRPRVIENHRSLGKFQQRCYPGALAFAIMLAPASVHSAQAQTLTVLHSFLGPEGTFPNTGLVRNAAGNLYGTAYYGGLYENCDNENGGGPSTSLVPPGKATTLHAFNNGSDGCSPSSGVILDAVGNLYGTTIYNTVFKVAAAGQLTLLYTFLNSTNGSEPAGSLLRDAHGNLFGAIVAGGHSNGTRPAGGVIRDSAGNLYGTTYEGGAFGNGAVFKIAP